MRTISFFLIASCILLASCSDDDQIGSHLHQIQYYSYLYPPSNYYGEKTFHYDELGRIRKTVLTDIFNDTETVEFTYEENMIIGREVTDFYEITYQWKFEAERLIQFSISYQTEDLFDTDTANFLYESGKLEAIQFGEDMYELDVDDSGNITGLQWDENYDLKYKYSSKINPLHRIPSNFISLGFYANATDQLIHTNIVQYFSPNTMSGGPYSYKYRDGKVIEMKQTFTIGWSKSRFTYRNL